jgi:hypothetical protein
MTEIIAASRRDVMWEEKIVEMLRQIARDK